ncbi:hypothetical protein [Arthrobacter sedimenti]|uniref:hypothetical protein n=1 Tax=Arthrobacter sedimenti TaxID=2694931 RepID=UPI000B35AF58|nr:hypothetical protein [Arthrobacter sedimenti]OUM44680.1 hypothetical protein B8W73_02720 [Arthrobacter agilis]
MAVSGSDFKQWLEGRGITTSASELSRLTGLHRVTVGNQMRRGNVPESTVVGVARAYGIDPVAALADFKEYEDLDSRPRSPTAAEVLSQVHHADLMVELQHRTQARLFPRDDHVRIDFPHDGSHRAWIDAIDTGDVRHDVAEKTGTAITYLFTQLSDNKLTPIQAVTAARVSGTSLVAGLVVVGLITMEEGDWPEDVRETALRVMKHEELIELIQQRLNLLQRRVRQRKEALEYAEQLTDLIG